MVILLPESRVIRIFALPHFRPWEEGSLYAIKEGGTLAVLLKKLFEYIDLDVWLSSVEDKYIIPIKGTDSV